MSQPLDTRATVLALHRFGLGARPGDLVQLGTHLREALHAEVAARTLPNLQNLSHPTMAEVGPAFFAFADSQRQMREQMAKPKPDATVPAAADRMVPDAATVPSRDGNAAPAAPPRDGPPLPNRLYQEEAKARFHAALEPHIGFGERLVQFWSNHFCVSVAKGGIVRPAAGVFEREAIRPHVYGRFADMLRAVASSPAMLVYLDNQLSIGPGSRAGQRRGRGLNENLAREIMELHTLGVAGGYTQSDVTSLARILTGWTMAGREGALGTPGTFIFNANLHEPGEHILLGRGFADTGVTQGRNALDMLARHPATARHIARKLARHFIADDPPAALVEKLATVFLRTDGDLHMLAKALIEAPESWSFTSTKIRSPQEFLLASMRALGRKPEAPQILGPLNAMGQQLWQPPGPNGFSDLVATWATPEGVKTRLETAAAIARQAAGTVHDPRQLTDDILGALASPETRQTIARAESKPQALALFLMSPEFQRR